jgi:hypothetical protein
MVNEIKLEFATDHRETRGLMRALMLLPGVRATSMEDTRPTRLTLWVWQRSLPRVLKALERIGLEPAPPEPGA